MDTLNYLLDNVEVIPHTGGIYLCGPDWSIPERTIPDFDFWYVADGRGRVTITGQEYEAGPGDLFLFRPGQLHSAVQTLPHSLTVHALHFNALVQNAVELFDLLPLPVCLSLPANQPWTGHLRQAAEETGSSTPGAGQAAAHHAGLFCISLVRWLRAEGTLPVPETLFSTDERVMRVIGYLKEHLTRHISVTELASVVSVSESLLYKTVKAATGYPPNALGNRIRVNTACRLLKNQHCTIAETARAVGIEDEAYFSRLFKKQTGLSPKRYQLQINEVKI